MGNIHQLYKDNHSDDTRYRSKLKAHINEEFPNELQFLTIDGKTPQVIVSKKGISENTVLQDKEILIKQTASLLRGDILDYMNTLVDTTWPPTIESLTSNEKTMPKSLKLFMNKILTPPNHGNHDYQVIDRLSLSYARDLIHGVTRGKVITLKHYLVGTGLHNITGQKTPIQILSRLGHSMEYNVVCQIETAEAKVAIQNMEKKPLKLVPADENATILTVFWADNFNAKVDNDGKIINSTHMVAFQESTSLAVKRQFNTLLQKTKIRSLEPIFQDKENIIANPKKEPQKIEYTIDIEDEKASHTFNVRSCIWKLLRHLCEKDQKYPKFSGWVILLTQASASIPLKQTVTTYLPPINEPVTEFTTIFKYLSYMQTLAKSVNMPYVNVFLDVGAAMNACKLLWNYPDKFDNVLVHLGDFHFMKEICIVLGTIVDGSGFNDILFQANLCTSECQGSIIYGSHYNRCWRIHESFAEALERLFMEKFIDYRQLPIPEKVTAYTRFIEVKDDVYIINDQSVLDFYGEYLQFRDRCRAGDFGKTVQFWITMYLDIVEVLHMIHTAVQTNNFDLRVVAWKKIMPFFFGLNKTNYARYGAYYLRVLESVELEYPGCKDLLSVAGLSIQAQENYPCRTAVDQRGEQSINRDAKTSGGIKYFYSNQSKILKWTMNRAKQSENTSELKSMADIDRDSSTYKSLRPSEIIKSEKKVQRILKVLQEEYINPFNEELDNSQLYNLSSGIPVPGELAESILKTKEEGQIAYSSFVEDRFTNDTTMFHDPIKRKVIRTFKDTARKVRVEKNGKTKVLEVNRNFLSFLLTLSAKTGKSIDYQKALKHPLCAVPLSLSDADGSRRSTVKSKLNDLLIGNTKKFENAELPRKVDVSVYIVDLMALIRTMTKIPETYEDFAIQLFKMIPSGYERVDIIVDSYIENSIKEAERTKRGTSQKVTIQSSMSKIPRNFNDFLKNSENKTRLIALIKEVMIRRRSEILRFLRTEFICISTYKVCELIDDLNCVEVPELSSDQEEADTKVCLHAMYALQTNPEKHVIIRSHSGDIDINILLTSLIIDGADKVFVDFNTGKNRKVFQLGEVKLTADEKRALIGFHAFTGNDYVSSFFGKGKQTCWKVLNSDPKYLNAFKSLGLYWELDSDIFKILESFVCQLYGRRHEESVNEARYKNFKDTYEKKNIIPDLSLLPPCQDTLKLHYKRSNFVAALWRLSTENKINAPSPIGNGWKSDLSVEWIKEPFPEDVELLVIENQEEIEHFEESSWESNSESDSESE